jgi:predicted Zn-dependent peptidase
MALAMDKPENVLGEALDDITFRGHLMSPEQTLERIAGVTLLETLELARELLRREFLSVAVVGDYTELLF